MIPLWANCVGLNAGLSFWLPLDDLGAGAVNTTPASAAGSATSTFTRATTATTILSNGLIGSVASGTPRSCYSPSGIYLGYLAEEARTNLCLQSQDFTNASWTPTAMGASTLVASPSGATNANKAVPTAASSGHLFVQNFTKAASALPYTLSIYAKADGYNFIAFRVDDNAGNGAYAVFNASTGAVATAGTGFGVAFTSLSTAVVSAGNSFYRFVLMFTTNTATTVRVIPYVMDSIQNPTTYTFTGDGSSGVDVWGAQLEQAAFATSYIPTTTASVTRNEDVLTYPASGNVIGVTGSAYAEATWANSAAVSGPDIIDTFPSAIQLNIGGAGAVGLYDGSSRIPGPTLGVTTTTIQKVATKWDGGANSCNGCGNGTLGTPAAWTTPTLGATMYIGNRQGSGSNLINGSIKNLRIWTRALADSQLVSLTS